MNFRKSLGSVLLVLSVLSVAVDQAAAQGGPPWARRGGGRGQGWGTARAGLGRGAAPVRQGGGADAQFAADREVFHYLLQNHDQIRRDVKNTPDGVATLTESDKPEIAAKLQEHVAAMAKRVEERRPIHMRDPLFAEVFRHADKIHLKYEKTPQGVRVVETSDDPYVVKLIQAHGMVVSLFVKNGFDEARQNHEVPGAETGTAVAVPGAPGGGCPLAAAGQCPKAAAGQCPKAAAGQCPKAAAGQCPKAAAGQCPKAAAGQCPAGANCPSAKPCPAGKNCPNAQACPAGKDCPKAQQCPAGSACAGCPAAGACPQSGTDQAPPLPKR